MITSGSWFTKMTAAEFRLQLLKLCPSAEESVDLNYLSGLSGRISEAALDTLLSYQDTTNDGSDLVPLTWWRKNNTLHGNHEGMGVRTSMTPFCHILPVAYCIISSDPPGKPISINLSHPLLNMWGIITCGCSILGTYGFLRGREWCLEIAFPRLYFSEGPSLVRQREPRGTSELGPKEPFVERALGGMRWTDYVGFYNIPGSMLLMKCIMSIIIHIFCQNNRYIIWIYTYYPLVN